MTHMGTQCQKPLDKLFSLFAIFDQQFRQSGLRFGMRPDYSSNVVTVLSQFTAYMLKMDNQCGGGLMILHFLRSSAASDYQLPSWVPDWTSSDHDTIRSYQLIRDDSVLGCSGAPPHTPANVSVQYNIVLRLSCHHFDTIDSISATYRADRKLGDLPRHSRSLVTTF